ncbi:repressor LexA [Candidatus Gottesmanbacteria bacterium RIFCSPLOWO2_01_FULL_39_12b]|uniref:LexA repressor n=1 Tax=Candidatus Gottesmanbacteria bacterium RIFCSPLOWO2_01_FULL_39_12b TaxID=1798388 RepID=A0A1F6AQX3_9BACT|nr:MAG: repressor LexA [Candidatus Gottesmanbacteria bacterium RIFCSPLOWO2_01_FULL_39_12b]
MTAILYNRERQTLEFIQQYIQRHGYAPTLAEIAESLGVNAVSTVHEHLQRLVLKGFVKKTAGFERGIELINEKRTFGSDSAIELPVLGFIAAGAPLEPHTDPNFYLSVPANIINSKRPGFILQVKGNSMVDEGILDGDYVIVQHQQDAQNGDIVVAILPNGFATLKRIFFEKDRIKLQPANASMTPIFTTHVKIQGRVVAVFRKYQIA